MRSTMMQTPLSLNQLLEDLKPEKDFDVNAKDFNDLAAKLGL